MKIPFIKMQGAGNDYVYVDAFATEISDPETLARAISDRHYGVGGDGLILIAPPEGDADGRMRMYNQDGSEGRMCGNGIRCVGKYLYESGRAAKEILRVETKSGVKTLKLTVDGGRVTRVRVDMGPAEFAAEKIPARFPGPEAVDVTLAAAGADWRVTCVSMGNPHCVTFGGDPDLLKLEAIGPCFERHGAFPEGVNTEFIQVLDAHTLKMRVWERGSGETLACGTGACASVAAAVRLGYCPAGEDVRVILRGGELSICYTPETVWMEGGAQTVFEGIYPWGETL